MLAGTRRSLPRARHSAQRRLTPLLSRSTLARLYRRSGSMSSAADQSAEPAVRRREGGGKSVAAVQLRASSGGGGAHTSAGPVLIQVWRDRAGSEPDLQTVRTQPHGIVRAALACPTSSPSRVTLSLPPLLAPHRHHRSRAWSPTRCAPSCPCSTCRPSWMRRTGARQRCSACAPRWPTACGAAPPWWSATRG